MHVLTHSFPTRRSSELNLAWGTLLIRRGRRLRSPALAADGHPLMTDVGTSVGVIAGVTVVALTGWTRLDAVIAALVALNILWAGWKIMQDSVAGDRKSTRLNSSH